MQDLGLVDPKREDLTAVFVWLLWGITALATISVVSGLSVGVKILANLAFGLGNFILFLCFVMEKTDYLMNLLVQTTGVYFQYSIFKIPFWTDAFGSLTEGEGRAIDDNASASWFIGSWTVFYMAWWTAWACFVGMFIARISRNRTLREVIISVFICPQNLCIVILEQATSMSRVHTLVYFILFCSNNLGRKFIGFYDPGIKTIYCNLTK